MCTFVYLPLFLFIYPSFILIYPFILSLFNSCFMIRRFHFATKLVRGAYMVLERKRAAELNYPDPVHPSIEHTHASYHKALDEVLERMAAGKRVEVMFASHNQRSITHALEKMNALHLPPSAGVYFGQLLIPRHLPQLTCVPWGRIFPTPAAIPLNKHQCARYLVV